jgi:hypothetical protein
VAGCNKSTGSVESNEASSLSTWSVLSMELFWRNLQQEVIPYAQHCEKVGVMSPFHSFKPRHGHRRCHNSGAKATGRNARPQNSGLVLALVVRYERRWYGVR